jgi:hypothetical protein
LQLRLPVLPGGSQLLLQASRSALLVL